WAVPAWYADPKRGAQVSRQAIEVSQSLDDPQLLAETRLSAASFRLCYDTWRKEDEDVCAAAGDIAGNSKCPGYSFSLYVLAVKGEYRRVIRNADALMAQTANPMDYILGLGAKMLALLHLGRFGEALEMARNGREAAGKNGADPWVHVFREA